MQMNKFIILPIIGVLLNLSTGYSSQFDSEFDKNLQTNPSTLQKEAYPHFLKIHIGEGTQTPEAGKKITLKKTTMFDNVEYFTRPNDPRMYFRTKDSDQISTQQ